MSAGLLRDRLSFQRRQAGDDGFGQETVGEFATVFTCAAQVTPRMGSEAILQSRLNGEQPVSIRVRQSTDTLQVDATWRAVSRGGVTYSIVSPLANVDQKDKYLDMLAVAGSGGQ